MIKKFDDFYDKHYRKFLIVGCACIVGVFGCLTYQNNQIQIQDKKILELSEQVQEKIEFPSGYESVFYNQTDVETINQSLETIRIFYIMDKANPNLSNKDKMEIHQEIIKASKKWKINSTFIASLIRWESVFKKEAVSKVGAEGLMQVYFSFKPHLKQLEKRKITMEDYQKSIHYQIDIGSEILEECIRLNKGNFAQALFTYNGRNGANISYVTNILSTFNEAYKYSNSLI